MSAITIADCLTDRESIVIREEIGSDVTMVMPSLEPWFRDMILGSARAGVEFETNFAGKLGRSLLMKKRFSGSLTGVIRGGQQSDFFTAAGDLTTDHGNTHYRLAPTQTWPDPTPGAVAAKYGFTSTIYGVDTNLLIELGMLQLEATPANIAEHLTPLVRGFGRNIAYFFANSWHADPANQYRLCGLGPASGDYAYSVDTTNKRITFTPSNFCSHKFAQGMQVDLFSDATTRKNEASTVRIVTTVDDVDDWSGQVTLQIDPSDSTFATWSGQLGDNAYVKHADTYDSTWGHRGFYSWKNFAVWGGSANADNRILRDQAITTTSNDYLDIRTHSWCRSGYHSGVGALTERRMMGILENARNAMLRWGHSLDTGVMSRGIINNIFETYQAREQFERGATPGSPVTMQTLGRFNGLRYRYEDMVLDLEVSQFMDLGQCVFFRRQGNWALITPPSPAGVQRNGIIQDEELDPVIPLEFPMGAIAKNSNPWVPYSKVVNSVPLPTQYTMLPGQIKAQFMPIEQIPMLVLDGVSTSLTWSPKVTS